MLEMNEFIKGLSDDIKEYCEHNKINFEECIRYLQSFIEIKNDKDDEGLSEAFFYNFKNIYDSEVSLDDKRNCLDRLIRYEPFLKKICFMKFPENKKEINNLSGETLIKKLELVDKDFNLNCKENNYESNSFKYHLITVYQLKNDTSHRWKYFNERELYAIRYTVSIFYIEVINRVQNILRKSVCLPNETIEYYAKYTDKNGIPYGIKKLTFEQVKRRFHSYKFIISNKKLVKVIHINSTGNPCGTDGTFDDPVVQEIKYPDDNTIRIECTNSTGKKINFIKEYKRNFNQPNFDRVNFYQGDNSSSFHLLNNEIDRYLQRFNDESFDSSKADISGYRIKRNSEGFIIRAEFLRYHGEDIRQSDKNDNFGFEYEVNHHGLTEKQFFLDNNGKRKKGPTGIWCVIKKYNDRLELEEVTTQNNDGKRKVICKYDDVGNILHQIHFVQNKKHFIIKYSYNFAGHLIERSYFNGKEKPTYHIGNYHRVVFNYDENSYHSSQEFYGVNKNDKVMGDVNGAKCWKVLYKYNEFGYLLSESYYDCNENLLLGSTGTAKIEYIYDIAGNKIEEKYLGLDGKPTCDNLGIAIISSKYENNKLIEQLFFDNKHKPVLNDKGFHKITYKYYKVDSAENIQEISLFGLNSKSIAKEKIVYNSKGLITDIYKFTENEKKGDVNGLYHVKYEYNLEGEKIKESFYDSNNNLMLRKSSDNIQYAIQEIKVDGSTKEIVFKNEQNNPIFRKIISYDEFGNEISNKEYEIINKKEKLVTSFEKKYDDFHRCIEKCFTNEKGDVIEIPSGGYYIKYEYWHDSREKCRKYLDDKRKLIAQQGLKWAYYIKKYNESNNIIEKYFYDVNNKPTHIDDAHQYVGYRIEYDSLSRPIAQYCFDSNKKTVCYLKIEYLDNNLCKFVFNTFRNIEEDSASYEVENKPTGTLYLFKSSKLGVIKIMISEL